MTWAWVWFAVSLALGALCVLVPGRAATLLISRGATFHFPLTLAAFAAGMLPVAAADLLEPLAERATGWMMLPQWAFFTMVSLASGGVAWFLVERAAEELSYGPPEKRLGRRMTEARWKAVVVIWTLACVVAMGALYWGGGICDRVSPSAGYLHDDASFWLVVVFWLCVSPTHAVVAWIGYTWRHDPELRPIPRHLVVYGISGVLFPALMILIRLDWAWMRWPDDVADIVMWAIELAGLRAISEYALITHHRSQDQGEAVGAGTD